MTSILLLQLDGKLPNLALMRLGAHHGALGHAITLRRAGNLENLEPHLDDPCWSRVYASLIFERSRHLGERVRAIWPNAILGGTGWSLTRTLDDVGVPIRGPLDYSLYPEERRSIGFTQRGCRMRCSFCVVPQKEGAVRDEQSIAELWRGEPWPRELLLLDNDFFGQPAWKMKLADLATGNFRVSFNQGINARMLTDETAAAIASVDYRADDMKTKRLYTAWDNRKDEGRLFAGLEALVRHGVKPDEIMVYMLIGYWPGETHEDREYRRARLRAFGARPYPMPYIRTPELVGFQRWVIRRLDLNVSWAEFCLARWQPANLSGSHNLELEQSFEAV